MPGAVHEQSVRCTFADCIIVVADLLTFEEGDQVLSGICRGRWSNLSKRSFMRSRQPL